jgi:adenosylhomocysteine nucleosidase
MSTSSTSRPTAILSALAEEQLGLIALLHEPRKTRHASREFWSGELFGQPVVLALSKIGKVAAATTATALIERFGVARIVFTGVAGGVGEGVEVGDIVVATDFVQHDLDASPLFPRYEVPLYGRSRFDADLALASAALRGDLALAGHVVVAVEMEGAAVAQVCHDYGVPFAAVRAISDRADDAAHVDFPLFIKEVASRYAQAIIARLLALLPPAT